MPRRCRVCKRRDREFYAKTAACKECHLEAMNLRNRERREEVVRHSRSERRRAINQCRVRDLILQPNLLDLVDRSERRDELARIGGLKGIHTFKARLAAARAVKVAACGRDIPEDLLAAILPP